MIQFKNVSFSYEPETPILKNISFTLNSNEIVGIVGESGSGKSTISSLMLNMSAPDSGTIERHASKILPIFQHAYNCFNPKKTIRASLKEALKYYAQRASDFDSSVLPLMQDMDLSEALLDQYPDQLSGGQLQRFNTLRSLMLTPEVLVCDEITSNLDVVAETKLIEILQTYYKKHDMSMIMISHDIAVLNRFVQRLIVVQNGRIVDNFPIHELFDDTRHDYTKSLIAMYDEA